MRISDWSSDVCSSDLRLLQGGEGRRQRPAQQVAPGCERADAKAVIAFVDGALARESRYVEDIVVKGPTNPRGIDVGAAGEHGIAAVRQSGERAFDRLGAKVGSAERRAGNAWCVTVSKRW